jgi:hypothetical protein
MRRSNPPSAAAPNSAAPAHPHTPHPDMRGAALIETDAPDPSALLAGTVYSVLYLLTLGLVIGLTLGLVVLVSWSVAWLHGFKFF